MLAIDDAAIRRFLNRDWRNLDKATNVPSFPACRLAPGTPILVLGTPPSALYATTCARSRSAEGKAVRRPHLAHLAVHGFLHLLGYDHESEPAAHDMEHLEARILARLGVPDPYSLRDRV